VVVLETGVVLVLVVARFGVTPVDVVPDVPVGAALVAPGDVVPVEVESVGGAAAVSTDVAPAGAPPSLGCGIDPFWIWGTDPV
jgi:hypothetical protein